MIGVTHTSPGNNASTFFRIKDKLRRRYLRRRALPSKCSRRLPTSNPPTDPSSRLMRNEIERLERKNMVLEKERNDAVDLERKSQKQQRQLYNSFKLLREKYDDLRTEMHHILWDFIPLNQCAVGGFKELAEVNHAVFETVDQISDYAIGSLLGEGHFADVKSCNHLLTQKRFAVKIMPKQKITTLACLQRVQTEIYLLKKLDHPNIVTFADFINSPKCLYLITEVGGKDLFDYFDTNPNGVSNEVARQIGLGIAKPLSFLHSSGICHRDLKPENILIFEDKDGSPLSQHNVQICDFGESVFGASHTEKSLSDLCGSPGFFAPEMILGRDGKYNGFAADMWSIGCIMLELTRGHDYFCKVWMASYESNILQDNDEFGKSLKKAVIDIDKMRGGGVEEEKLVHFLQEMLVIDPDNRIDSSAMLSHPWFCIDKPNRSVVDNDVLSVNLDQEVETRSDNVTAISQSVESNATVKANTLKRRKRSIINIRYSSTSRAREYFSGMDTVGANEHITDLDGLCHCIAAEFKRESDQ